MEKKIIPSLLSCLFFFIAPLPTLKFQIALFSSLHDVPNSLVNSSELLEPLNVGIALLCVYSQVDRNGRHSSSRIPKLRSRKFRVTLTFPFSEPSFGAAFHNKRTCRPQHRCGPFLFGTSQQVGMSV